MRRALAVALLAALGAGCAAARTVPRERSARSEAEIGDAASEREASPQTPGAEPLQEPQDLVGGEPYGERPGSEEGPAEEDARPVRFAAPTAPLPLPPARRPALPERWSLAAVWVRAGVLVRDPDALLRLDAALRDEEGLRAVAALPWPRRSAVGLPELAAAARRAGRDLLLVEVRAPGNPRVGYLVHAASGDLWARYEAPAAEGRPAERKAGDLLARLGRAFAGLR
ncbi:MAG: hypothetical protein D6731_04395 [Planctomycetota bacterium]|nr:MAG: hypothetical protein D6731_04395 [Planctomycetota bacterium]